MGRLNRPVVQVLAAAPVAIDVAAAVAEDPGERRGSSILDVDGLYVLTADPQDPGGIMNFA